MNEDPTNLPALAEAQAARKTKAEHAALLKASDYKWLMSQPRGRRLMWRLLEETGLFRSSFTGNSETFFREGERNVGLKTMAILNEHCVEDYAQMLLEKRDYE